MLSKKDPNFEILFPPFCPNVECIHHIQKEELSGHFAIKNGWAKRAGIHPIRVQQYRCKDCGRSFRSTYFSLAYRVRAPSWYTKQIFEYFICGISNREIARKVGCGETLVRERLKKLSQWALLKQTQLTENLRIKEAIVYDGLEAYAKSQYDPNNINQAIGKNSLFIYDFNFTPLNRKGRMSPRQKNVNQILESTVGRYSTKATRIATGNLLFRLHEKREDTNQPLILYTDNHYQYRDAIRLDLKHIEIKQIITPSKDYRNYKNNLFAVNHSDLIIRHYIGAFSRETICFSKTHERMIGKFALFMIYKNFMREIFVKPHKKREKANIHTPAMELGICSKKLIYEDFFDQRITPEQVQLSPDWQHFYYEQPVFKREIANTRSLKNQAA